MSKIFGAGIWFDLISTDDFSDWNMLMEKGHKKKVAEPLHVHKALKC